MTILKALATSGMILVAAAGKPADTAKPGGDLAADGLADTFAQTCLAYAGREAQLKVWLDANMQTADENQAPYFLGAMTGKVWLRSNGTGNYAVIVYDLGLCTVKAEKAPFDDALKSLEKKADTLHLKLTQTADGASGVFQDVAGHVRSYSIAIDGVHYAIIGSGTQEASGPLQSQFTLLLSDDNPDATP